MFVYLILFQLCAAYLSFVESSNKLDLKRNPFITFFIIKEYLENMEKCKKEHKDYL